ncbi:MAG: radical SAM protein [Myxococcota bacterium]|jgi:hypothetical protein|nr:radical SAM protein [Myxococcota bacterium]
MHYLRPSSEGKGPRILLTSVFGPYGVDDAFGRKENVMELFHNQVTKAQGPASFRFHHRSFGLYFLAANVDADVTVLDFPSRKRFLREIEKGYDIVGISFIAPNFEKARYMASAVRNASPQSEIILGGHGAAIPDVGKRIDCDHVVRGEGISWLRSHLGQDPNTPIVHPVLPSTERQSIHGVPLPGKTASLLVPGVGCVNGCKFCATSHFFGKVYTPFATTGKELFELACAIADRRGTESFFVMDENFLKDTDRALEFLSLMEQHRRYFEFSIFSSAEAIKAFGVDNMVRLGVSFVWIGVESANPHASYDKNSGSDPAALVRSLRDRGIGVLASGILCAEHHTQQNIQAEIDFLVQLGADFVQFMLLSPMPVTGLYLDHARRGLLRHDLPLEEWHGQKHLAYRHPEFKGGESEKWLERAFRQDYEVNGSSIYRLTETSWRGYRRLVDLVGHDPCLAARRDQLLARARSYSLLLPHIARRAVNDTERLHAQALQIDIETTLGDPVVPRRLAGLFIHAAAAAWDARVETFGDRIQPATIVTRFEASNRHRSGVIAPSAISQKQEPARLQANAPLRGAVS